jgi:hypothetical protein
MFGTRLGERGHLLLERAYHLFEKVQFRIDAEKKPSKHWSTLKLVVLNNQACIFHDFSMHSETLDRLKKLASILFSAPILDRPDWKIFYLTLHILSRDEMAAAA